ncbi:unnamed protein product [Brassica rapa]|uniref:3,4-dihydroxy-2-butanone kinase n=1 Tax=Brassica campestris TaxID=3711 RepID=A0A8D9DGS7_BRACM|nr:unnamed protein product [Brassica rapa]
MVYAAKKFINNPNDAATDVIKGLVDTYPGLQFLLGFGIHKVKVVIQAGVSVGKYDKVAVISGGGYGHEPAHAGYVGEGMLTAAICGDVFASPSVGSIVAGIRAVTGSQGCLLIVKNYTADRLNFGLAAEEAKYEGYKVETVIVGEDCALPPPRGFAGRRGLAGTILVHKVAGAAAAAGLSLEEVAAEAKCASEMVGTMGVAFSLCKLLGPVTSDRLGQKKMELGLGIHGEPGAAVVDVQPVDVVVSLLLQKILSPETNYVPITRGDRVVLMVNGLGGTPLMELMIVAGKTVSKLQLEFGLAVDRVYTGFFMTSLDMAGFSISIMKADQSTLDRLDAPTKAPSWPVGSGTDGNRPYPKIFVPCRPNTHSEKRQIQHWRYYRLGFGQQPDDERELSQQGRVLKAAIRAAANAIISLKYNLNEWGGVSDGRFGSKMCIGAKAILKDMKYYPLYDAAETMYAIGASISKAMGGTTGIMYNLLCKAAYAELKKDNIDEEVTPRDWSEALKASIASVRKYGGATEGYRTMLDALIPASQVLEENLSAGVDPVTAFSVSAVAATKGAKSTIQMQAQAGRLSAENLATVPDPGAMAAAVWYRAAARAVRKKQHLKPYEGSVVPKSPTVPSRDGVFYFDFPDIGRHTCRDPTFVKTLGAVEVTPSGGSPRSTVGQSDRLSCNLGALVSVRKWGIIRFKKNGENKTFVARQGCRITVPFGGIVTYCNSIVEIFHHSGFWWNSYLLSYYSIPPKGVVDFLRSPDKTNMGYVTSRVAEDEDEE